VWAVEAVTEEGSSELEAIGLDTRTLVKHSKLSDDEKKEVLQLLEAYTDVWADGRRGAVRGLTHAIKLTTNRPIVDRPRVHSGQEQEVISREIDASLLHHSAGFLHRTRCVVSW
jgi:hypothetical protein